MVLKNKNIIFKIRRSKVTDYAALKVFDVCLLFLKCTSKYNHEISHITDLPLAPRQSDNYSHDITSRSDKTPCLKIDYTTFTNFSMKYLVMCKVYTDIRGIKQLYHVCPPVRKIIHSPNAKCFRSIISIQNEVLLKLLYRSSYGRHLPNEVMIKMV